MTFEWLSCRSLLVTVSVSWLFCISLEVVYNFVFFFFWGLERVLSTHWKYISNFVILVCFPLQCFIFFHLIPCSLCSKFTALIECHTETGYFHFFYFWMCSEVILKLALSPSPVESHSFRTVRVAQALDVYPSMAD